MGECAQVGGALGVFGDRFGHNVLGALKGGLRRGEAGVGVHVAGGHGKRVALGGGLQKDEVGQGLKARVTRLGRAGGSLLLEGLVEVFHALHDCGVLDGGA